MPAKKKTGPKPDPAKPKAKRIEKNPGRQKRKPRTKSVRANGKPRKLSGRVDKRTDPAMIRALEGALLSGNSYIVACELAGIGKTTFFRYLQEGEEANPGTIAREFRDRIKRAEATAMGRNILHIQKAAKKDWRAAAWFLERRAPQDYGNRVQIGGDPNGVPVRGENVNVNVNGGEVPKPTPEESQQVVGILPDSMSAEACVSFLEEFYAGRANYRGRANPSTEPLPSGN